MLLPAPPPLPEIDTLERAAEVLHALYDYLEGLRQEVERGKTAVVLTVDLPTAAAAQDGRYVIEDAGAGDRNLVFYAGGQRFRVDGGAPV